MHTIRVLVAALFGGVVMFVFGATAHMMLQIDNLYVRSLPDQTSVTNELKAILPERGFYFFPGIDEQSASESEIEAWRARLRAGPRGVVVFDPSGGEMMESGQLGYEFASNVVAALILAIVLLHVRGGWARRALLAGLLGVFATLSIDVSYWNWYRFPDGMVVASLIEQGVGWLLAGAAISAILLRQTKSKSQDKAG